jgi:hypothetical protein
MPILFTILTGAAIVVPGMPAAFSNIRKDYERIAFPSRF